MAVRKKDDLRATAVKVMLEAQKTAELLAKATHEQAQKDLALHAADKEADEKQQNRAAAINSGLYDVPSSTIEVTSSHTVDTAFKPLIVGKGVPVSSTASLLEFSASVIKYSIEAHAAAAQHTQEMAHDLADVLANDPLLADTVAEHGGRQVFINNFTQEATNNFAARPRYHEATVEQHAQANQDFEDLIVRIKDKARQPQDNISMALQAIKAAFSKAQNEISAATSPADALFAEQHPQSSLSPFATKPAPIFIKKKEQEQIENYYSNHLVVSLFQTSRSSSFQISETTFLNALLNTVQNRENAIRARHFQEPSPFYPNNFTTFTPASGGTENELIPTSTAKK